MEKINAVEMVRKIRDKQYEETKKLSRTDLLKYFNKNGGKALQKLRGNNRAPKTSHTPRVIKDILQGAVRDFFAR